jgi:hypothetical protein
METGRLDALAEAIGVSSDLLAERAEVSRGLLDEDAIEDLVKAHDARRAADDVRKSFLAKRSAPPSPGAQIDAAMAKGAKQFKIRQQLAKVPDSNNPAEMEKAKRKQLKLYARDRLGGVQDPLAAKAGAKELNPDQGAMQSTPGLQDKLAKVRQANNAKGFKAQQDTDRFTQARDQALAPQAAPAQPGMLRRGISAFGRVASRAAGYLKNKMQSRPAAEPAQQSTLPASEPTEPTAPDQSAHQDTPAQAAGGDSHGPGFGSRVAGGAKSVLGKIGGALSRVGGRASGVLRAKMRMRHPGLAHLLYGAPGDNEKAAASHMGLAHHYAALGHDIPGLDHQYQQAYLRGADRRYSNPYRQRLAKAVPNNPRFSR